MSRGRLRERPGVPAGHLDQAIAEVLGPDPSVAVTAVVVGAAAASALFEAAKDARVHYPLLGRGFEWLWVLNLAS